VAFGDRHGCRRQLVYVGGGGRTLQTLAQAMTDAGVQRGMELRAADRHLAPDQRDFFYLTLR
jgi:hypothetical protein